MPLTETMNDIDLSPLYRPFAIGGTTLPNRFAMAPMTRARSPGGVPTPEVAAYYRRRAEGGVGLIITEGTVVDRPSAKNNPAVPDLHGAGLEGWRRVVEGVHEAGGRIWSQLWHVGAFPEGDHPGWPPAPYESPSGLHAPGKPAGRAMSEEDIADTIAAFADAARDAHRIGFDGIELHGAHGYLIDQFYWAATNVRTDGWGGATLAERARFARELVCAVRAAIPADMPLSLRFSQWKIQDYDVRLAETPDALADWIGPLADAGVDIFHCSQRRYATPAFTGDPDNLAGWVKRITGRPVITVGSIGLQPEFYTAAEGPSLADLVRRLDRGEFDLAAVGRAILGDPALPAKLRAGRIEDIVPFTRDAIVQLT